MPTATPLARPDLEDLTVLDIFTNTQGLIDGDKLQRVLLYIIASVPNLLTDGLLTGNPGAPINVDYAALLRAIATKAEQVFVVDELGKKEPKFTGLAAADLATGKSAFAGLLLYQLLLKLVNQSGSGGPAYTAGPGIAIDASHLISAATVPLELPLAQPQPAANAVAPAALHAITGLWNGDNVNTTVYVFGLNPGAFASTGWVVDDSGVVQAVQVNVAAGTWDANPDPPVLVRDSVSTTAYDSLDLAFAPGTTDLTVVLTRGSYQIADNLEMVQGALLGNGAQLAIAAGKVFTLSEAFAQDTYFDGQGTLRIESYLPNNDTVFHSVFGAGITLQVQAGKAGRIEYSNVLGQLDIAGTLYLRPGARVPANYLASLTQNPNGSYTTAQGGTVIDERGGTGGSTTLYTATYTVPAGGGAQTITQAKDSITKAIVPLAGATAFADVRVRNAGGTVDSLFEEADYTFASGSLQILAGVGLVGGEVIGFSYAKGPVSGPAPAAALEVQVATDSTYRVAALSLTRARTIQSASVLASRNASGLTYQVNAYRSGGWVAGPVRMAYADANADMQALTAADFAAGAELLMQVAAVANASNARVVLQLLSTSEGLLVVPANRTALRSNTTFAPYSVQETDPAIRYSKPFLVYDTADAYQGSCLYVTTPGDWFETTAPAGCTQIVFEGYCDPGNANFDAYLNGAKVGSGTQSTAAFGGGTQRRVYYTFAGLQAGDVARIVGTGSGNIALVSDQATFS